MECFCWSTILWLIRIQKENTFDAGGCLYRHDTQFIGAVIAQQTFLNRRNCLRTSTHKNHMKVICIARANTDRHLPLDCATLLMFNNIVFGMASYSWCKFINVKCSKSKFSLQIRLNEIWRCYVRGHHIAALPAATSKGIAWNARKILNPKVRVCVCASECIVGYVRYALCPIELPEQP